MSAWAVTLAKRGQTVIETLPVFTTATGTTRSRITYNDSTNAQEMPGKFSIGLMCPVGPMGPMGLGFPPEQMSTTAKSCSHPGGPAV